MPESIYHRRTTCRLCGDSSLRPVLSLTPTPPANQFVTAEQLDRAQVTYPLDVHFCERCTHVQLVDVVDPGTLFEGYVYVSGTSPSFVQHFDRYAETLLARFAGDRGGFALDIGSNDGVLLRALQARGCEVLGVDPAKKIAAEATRLGVETWPTFFTSGLAERIAGERGRAKFVTANNVFAHADDLADITRGVARLLASDGVFAFEVSYLADVYACNLFDTIYHEHLAYHSVRPLEAFFLEHGLQLFDVERIGTHGGSIRGYVQLAGGPWSGAGVTTALAEETRLGLHRPETFDSWGERIARQGRELRETLGRLRAQGKRIAGFGAPAKATTLMYQFGLDRGLVEFIVDDSPWKQGLFSPGLHIPVLSAEALAERKPDCLLLLAWNFAEPIIEKYHDFIAGGGTFVVPMPELQVISA